jgi:phosphatidylinositol glycan class T
MRCYELPEKAEWDVVLPEQKLEKHTALKVPRVTASRSINGYGAERGSIQASISNPSLTEAIEVVYLESLPWYLKPYLHTLKTSISGRGRGSDKGFDPLRETYYRPALDRHRGMHLEVALTIPPASTLSLSYEFEKAILRYTEYPPDANRGFDVAAAVVRLLPSPNQSKDKGENIYVRTTSLLLPLPTPDFSMPYNVIILTSTVMALGFGSIFNMLVRRIVAADEVGPAPIALVIAKFRERIKYGVRRLIGKVQGGSEKKVQ